MSYQTSSKLSAPFWVLIGARKHLCFSAQSGGRTAATVWNWSGKTLSPGALFVVLYFSSCHIFPPVLTFPRPHYIITLSASGSPRMLENRGYNHFICFFVLPVVTEQKPPRREGGGGGGFLVVFIIKL